MALEEDLRKAQSGLCNQTSILMQIQGSDWGPKDLYSGFTSVDCDRWTIENSAARHEALHSNVRTCSKLQPPHPYYFVIQGLKKTTIGCIGFVTAPPTRMLALSRLGNALV